MKNILKLALTLMLITALSGGALSYVHATTSVIIAEREAIMLAETLTRFFPEVDAERIEKKEIEDDLFKVVQSAEGEFLGVLVAASARGYAGPILYWLVIDNMGQVKEIIYVRQQETPGIGTRILGEPFIGQIRELDTGDLIKPGEDIDVLSGATVSSEAMINALRNTINSFETNFLDQ